MKNPESGKTGFKKPSRRKGFTLVEMVLSLGIVSFAFVGIVGLLPFGLQNFRAAMDLTLQAQMAQNLVNTARQVSYADLQDLEGQTFCFDNSGNQVPSSDPGKVYEATVQIETDTDVPSDSGFNNSMLARMKITFTQGNGPGSQRTVGTFTAHIASMTGDPQL